MKSNVSKQLKADLLARCKAMSPSQRLEAFVAHCQKVAEFRFANPAFRSNRPFPQDQEDK